MGDESKFDNALVTNYSHLPIFPQEIDHILKEIKR